MGDQEQSDAELISAYLKGCDKSFDELYERYRLPLYGYLNRLCSGGGLDADDLFQQTWLRAVDRLSKYRNQEKFSAWLMRIAHNLTIDQLRKNARRSEDVFDDSMEEILPASRSSMPNYGLDQSELGEAISVALADLPPDLREVFLLRQEELSFREIAEIQKCSINTCLARMQYALKRMQKSLISFKKIGKE